MSSELEGVVDFDEDRTEQRFNKRIRADVKETAATSADGDLHAGVPADVLQAHDANSTAVFPDSASVNKALRSLAEIVRERERGSG